MAAKGSYPIPGYKYLATSRPQGDNLDAGQINVSHVSPTLLSKLDLAGKTLGKTVTIFSGYRTSKYSQKVGGFAGDPHSKGVAVDASIDGAAIGSYQGAVAVLHSLGLRSGATDFTYHGQSDPSHVDLLKATDGGGTPTGTPSAQPPPEAPVAPTAPAAPTADDLVAQDAQAIPGSPLTPPNPNASVPLLDPNQRPDLALQPGYRSSTWQALSALPGASPDTIRLSQLANLQGDASPTP